MTADPFLVLFYFGALLIALCAFGAFCSFVSHRAALRRSRRAMVRRINRYGRLPS